MLPSGWEVEGKRTHANAQAEPLYALYPVYYGMLSGLL
jgi:hypothetical protein